MMRFSRPDADVFVPDGTPMPDALARATHLCIGAHQDDQEFMAFHGIAECFGRKDKHFAGVVMTNGGGSSRTGLYADYSDEQMIAVRVQEQRKAATIGEYACEIQLMHPSGDVKKPGHAGVAADMRAIFEAVRPEVLYLHNPADKHDTHVAVCLRALAAIRSLPREKRPRRVLGCEIWRDLDWMRDEDKQVLPVDRHKNLAASLSGVFDSQITGGKRYDTAVAGRRMAHATFFESHATDKVDALSFAMDLTPLAEDDALDVFAYTQSLIRRFEDEVRDRLARLS
jgi:LmbE family N-acetylglucosaminyl deacetylase